jgi:Raf kinase inhibitor-like YbhB/YbcL family protein
MNEGGVQLVVRQPSAKLVSETHGTATMSRPILAAAALALIAAPAYALTLSSADVTDGRPIPVVHNYPRCGGQNISPQLAWRDAPKGMGSFAITMIDVGVKPNGWSHWVVTGIPASVGSLARGAQSLPAGARAVASNFGDAYYDGPCPPKGTGVHRYRITVWALPGADIAIAPDAKADAVEAQLKAAALASASITGTVTAP